MYLILCIVGVILLVFAVILCIIAHEHTLLWGGMLILGEIVSWIGAIPILLNFPR